MSRVHCYTLTRPRNLMSEEGEIPQHLQESVPSAEAYMADARREVQIATKAWELRIPRESLGNKNVHHYVGVLRDLKTAFEQLEWPEDDVWPADSPLHES